MIGECGNSEDKVCLIVVLELDKANAVIINPKIIQTLTDLNKGEINHKNLKLVISDGAPHALKVGKLLKSLFEDFKHVTCFCHMLHRICEFIRSINKRLDYFIAEFKRFFIKNKVNKEEFKTKCSVSLPEFPILTRWGTWINCACYIFKNYAEILKFLENETENFIYPSKMLKEVEVIEQLKIVKNWVFNWFY